MGPDGKLVVHTAVEAEGSRVGQSKPQEVPKGTEKAGKGKEVVG
jgi:hypothetical protein